MLTHSTSRIIFFTGITIVLLLKWWIDASLWWLLAPAVFYLAAIGYGASQIHSQYFLQTRYKGQTNHNQIAITFDDGPVEATGKILEILEKQNAKATFFCIGSRVIEQPEITRKIVRDGHIIGNHSFSHHALVSLFPVKRLLKEIKDTDSAILEVTGRKPLLFRPPYGVTNPGVASAIKLSGHLPIGWSVRSMDTVIKDEQKLYKNMVRCLQPGAVFLFHDTSAATLAILNRFLEEAGNQGFQVVGLDQLLDIKPYA